MNREEMLEKARRDYPIGTEYEPLNINYINGKPKTVKVINNSHHYGGTGEFSGIWVDSTGCCGTIYAQGKWAEIISTPQPQEDVTKMEKKPQFEVLGFCNKGDIIVSLKHLDNVRKIGDLIQVESYSGSIMYYEYNWNGSIGSTASSDAYTWRLATPEETAAYHKGVRNIEFVAAQEDNWEPSEGGWVVITATGFNNDFSGKTKKGDVYQISSIIKDTVGYKIKFTNGRGGYGSHDPDSGDSIKKCFRKALPHEIPVQETKQINSQLNVKHNGTTEGKTIKTNSKTAKVTSGKRSTGRTVSGRRGRSTVAVGHLSHKTITGS